MSNGTTGDGAAVLAGVNMSEAAQQAVRRAVNQLRPHAGEDERVAALVRKLNAIANPDDFDSERAGEIAKALHDSERIAKSEDASPALRERMRKASLELQRAHLSRYSAGGSAVW